MTLQGSPGGKFKLSTSSLEYDARNPDYEMATWLDLEFNDVEVFDPFTHTLHRAYFDHTDPTLKRMRSRAISLPAIDQIKLDEVATAILNKFRSGEVTQMPEGISVTFLFSGDLKRGYKIEPKIQKSLTPEASNTAVPAPPVP